ncbi:MAG: sulfotransferase [Pseudomonadota bacterium]
MPTFLYGIGAARAGTTWLSRALRGHPQVSLPAMKEVHYFDTVETGNTMSVMDQLVRVRAEQRAALVRQTNPGKKRYLRRRVDELDGWLGLIGSAQQNDQRYQELLLSSASHARLVADLTPAYATLSTETFARMAALNSGDTKFLMILRDPVERLWSNLRLTVERRVAKGAHENVVRDSLVREVAENPNLPELQRADYAGTLTRVMSVVPAERIKCMFFDDLFTAESLEKLSAFLGLEGTLEGPRRAVNTVDPMDMTRAERDVIGRAVAPQYEFAASFFGELPKTWRRNMTEVTA